MSSSIRMVAQLSPGSTWDPTSSTDPARWPASVSPLSDRPDIAPTPSGPLPGIPHAPYLGLVLSTLLPVSAILLTLAADVLSRLPYPPAVRRAARTLRSPFRDFFTLADVGAPTPCPLDRAPWKARVLVLGAVLQSLAWLAVLAYSEEVHDTATAVRAGASFLAWVRPLPSPPSPRCAVRARFRVLTAAVTPDASGVRPTRSRGSSPARP